MRIRDYSPMKGYRLWTDEEVEFLRSNCASMTCYDFAARLNRSQDSVRSKLKRLGLHARPAQRLQTRVNHDFFKIWTCDMAYVLGYWFADGYMSQPHHADWAFSISSKDKPHLQKILDVMESNHNIKTGKDGISVFKVGSKTIWHDLYDLGGRPAKSNITEFPYIHEGYVPDFIRGYFDGDGYIICSPALTIGFMGTHSFLKDLLTFLPSSTGTPRAISRFTFRLNFYGELARAVLRYMYEEANLYLDRKHQGYIRYVKHQNRCVDCEARISESATRCRSCSNKHKWANGIYDAILKE